MSDDIQNSADAGLSRRDLLKNSARLAAVSALAGVVIPSSHVFAGESNTIQLALIGCGGRGTGAAINALGTKSGPTKLVAMVDVFKHRLDNSLVALKQAYDKQVEITAERQYIGFDGYKHAMDQLKKGDVVILTTPVAFRWVHFTYAIQKGLNVFMEKPITVDGPSSRKMFALGEESVKKNIKVGVGLMCRHCAARGELFDRIKSGQIGELNMLRAYRNVGPTAHAFCGPKPADMSELMYQIQEFHAFLWASGGGYSDFLIHNIDESCWMKDAWPVEAKASGGRHYRGNYIDQNFDNYSVEYTFADGAKLFLGGRLIEGCDQEFASYCHGSKGSAIISTSSHSPAKPRIFKGQKFDKADMVWEYPQPEPNPYQLEWDHLIQAIRDDKPYNEVKRGAEASLVTAMGRMAAHTGKTITYDAMLNHEHEFAPDVDKLVIDGPAPLLANAEGKYPVPQPGLKTRREY